MKRIAAFLFGTSLLAMAIGPALSLATETPYATARLCSETKQLCDSQDPPHYMEFPTQTVTLTGHGAVTVTGLGTISATNGIAVQTTGTVTTISTNTLTASTTASQTGSATKTAATPVSTGTITTTSTGTATGTFTATGSWSTTGTATTTLSSTVTLTTTVTTGGYTTTATGTASGTFTGTMTQTYSATGTWTFTRTSTGTGTRTWTKNPVAGPFGVTVPGTTTVTGTVTGTVTAATTATATQTQTAGSGAVSSNPTLVSVAPTAGGTLYFSGVSECSPHIGILATFPDDNPCPAVTATPTPGNPALLANFCTWVSGSNKTLYRRRIDAGFWQFTAWMKSTSTAWVTFSPYLYNTVTASDEPYGTLFTVSANVSGADYAQYVLYTRELEIAIPSANDQLCVRVTAYATSGAPTVGLATDASTEPGVYSKMNSPYAQF